MESCKLMSLSVGFLLPWRRTLGQEPWGPVGVGCENPEFSELGIVLDFAAVHS